MNDDLHDDRHEDTVERLIKLAGPRPAVPIDIAARVKANVHDAWRAEVDKRSRARWIWTLPLAAAIATAVILTITNRPTAPATPWIVARIERVSGVNTLTTGQQIASRSTIDTANGRASVRLPDGTTVRIDDHSRVRFDTPHRIALQAGAVYITSAHSGLRVETPYGLVRDIGTRFEVRLTVNMARVRVRDGIVMVGAKRATRGQQLAFQTPAEVFADSARTWGTEWEWTNDVAPNFAIEGTRVSDFVNWVAGERGIDILYDSQATKARAERTTLHGSIASLRPDVAAKAILPTAGLHATIDDGVITVRQ